MSWTWTSGASKPGFGHAVMTPWCAAPQVVAAMAPAALAFYLPIGLALWSQRIHCSPNVDVGLGAARWARWAAERMRVSWRVVVKAFTESAFLFYLTSKDPSFKSKTRIPEIRTPNCVVDFAD